MKLSVKLLVIGLIFGALLSACGSKTAADVLDIETAIEDGNLEELPEEIQEVIALEENLPEFPVLVPADLSPSVVSPGDVISVITPPNLNGQAAIRYGSYSQSLNLASGSFQAPADAPDGVYSVLLDNEDGPVGLGTFRIASGPGIWISTSGNYVSEDEFAAIRVSAHQVPEDMFAIFRLGNLALDGNAEDDFSGDSEDLDLYAFDGPSAYLLPGPDGVLQLASFPGMPLSELTDQTFFLPGRLANQIQLYALDGELAQLMAEGFSAGGDSFEEEFQFEGQELASSIVSIQQCNVEAEIRGNLGGPGTVRVISLDGSGATRTSYSPDGAFSIQVPAGKTFVEGWLETEDGMTVFASQTVDLPCGESVEVSLAAISSPHLASLNPALPAKKSTAQAAGGDQVCERVYVDKAFLHAGEFEEFGLLSKAIAARLDPSLSRAAVASYADVQELLELAAEDQWDEGDGEGEVELGTARSIVQSDIAILSVISQIGGKQFVRVTARHNGPAGWSGYFAQAIIYGETIQELSRLPDSFIEKVQKAAVCASVEPVESVIEPNETVELTIEMTDLNGEAHDEVKVSLESEDLFCGSLEWTEKTIDGTSVSNTYTANEELSCRDTLVFVGEAEGPQGKVKSNYNHAVATILKPLLFHFNMQMVFYGENDGRIDFNWDADFYPDENNAIKTVKQPERLGKASGAFTSQAIHCEVRENGVLTFRSEDLKPNANWDLEVGGTLTIFENGFGEIRLIPIGTSWDFDMQPFPEECTVLIENIFIWFMRYISLQPADFVPGGAIEYGWMTDEPLKKNIPLEGSSGFDITISRAPLQSKQP